jgi:catechol 2,3-dioxygenase-like lactoylglutathione lyase family enzyme
MKLDKILETALYVEDLSKAKEFYCGILGLEKVSETPSRDLFIRCGDSMLLLFNPEQTKIDGGRVPIHGSFGQGHIAFGIPKNDIQDWITHLNEKGVEIEKNVVWDERDTSIYFRDPSGNSVELASETLYK